MFKFEKEGDITSQIIKALSELESSSVEVGHFASQGNHSTAVKPNGTPYSYVELMRFHHTGDAGSRPPRQPLNVLKAQNRNLSQHRWMLSAVKTSIKDILTKSTIETSLRRIAKNLVRLEKDIFGDPNLLAGTAHNTDPLIDTGELRSKVTYKTTFNGGGDGV
jgi:hypothetical protein